MFNSLFKVLFIFRSLYLCAFCGRIMLSKKSSHLLFSVKAYFMGTFVSADRTLSSNERSGLRSSLGGSTIKNCSSGVSPKTIFPQKFDWPNVGQWSMQRLSEGNRLAGYGILNFSLWYTKRQLITDQLRCTRLPICAQASILHHGAQHLKSRPRILSPRHGMPSRCNHNLSLVPQCPISA
jgi:hypothetical protein